MIIVLHEIATLLENIRAIYRWKTRDDDAGRFSTGMSVDGGYALIPRGCLPLPLRLKETCGKRCFIIWNGFYNIFRHPNQNLEEAFIKARYFRRDSDRGEGIRLGFFNKGLYLYILGSTDFCIAGYLAKFEYDIITWQIDYQCLISIRTSLRPELNRDKLSMII